VKLAAIVPIGYLDRHGYQNIHKECIDSIAAFADRVFLVSSVRDPGIYHVGKTVAQHGNEATWFARTPEGNEWFDAFKVMENVNLGAYWAMLDGFDVGICLFVNNYIPEAARAGLRYQCEQVLEATFPTILYYYRRDQLGDQMFSSSVRLPFVVDLRRGAWRFSTDSVVLQDESHDPIIARMERGTWPERDSAAVVDVQLEMTLDDLRDKMNFIRCYHDLVPKRKPAFEWGYWRRYYIEKFRNKKPAGLVEDPTGLAIAAKHREDFVSAEVLGGI
jgi:hypothetical protein